MFFNVVLIDSLTFQVWIDSLRDCSEAEMLTSQSIEYWFLSPFLYIGIYSTQVPEVVDTYQLYSKNWESGMS